MSKKISIVLPVYNGEKYITEAINSIMDQTYSNWELIIVNDCSTDNTSHIICDFASRDNRIKIINNTANQKLPRSLNIGFSNATGDYLTWTSDDNLFHPDALNKLSNVLNNDNDIALTYADYSIIDSDGKTIRQEIKMEPDEIRFNNIVGACFLYRKSLATIAGDYNPDMFLAEDYEFFLRCYKNGKFYHLNEVLYDYRFHGNSLTSSRHDDILRQTFKAMDEHFDFLLSTCITGKERYRLFFSMLSYTCDPLIEKSARNRFFKIDHNFIAAYYFKKLKNFIKKAIQSMQT